MRRYLLLSICLIPIILTGQNLKNIRQKSYQAFVYRIPADSTEKYITKDSIPVDVYLDKISDHTMITDSLDISTLPRGHYLVLTIIDNKIKAEIVVNSDLIVYAINNQKFIQLAVRDKWGNAIDHPKASIRKKPLPFSESAQTFSIRYRPKENDIIKVCSATDTVFLNLDIDHENYESVAKQKWRIFKGTTAGRIITFLPNKISGLFRSRRYKPQASPGKGFIVFNQPKYKLGDTVKLKAYILNRKNKRFNKGTKVYLQYYDKGKSIRQFLANVTASSPGAYLYEFILRDTLVNDVSYTLSFHSKKEKELVRNSFKVEDYVLDEVATYTIRSVKDNYFLNDSMVFIVSAKDANGLNLLDAKARLVLTVNSIENWNEDTVIVADTLYTEEKKLNTQGDTRFVVASSGFPKATLKLQAQAIFRNSNNEIQYQATHIEYNAGKHELVLRQERDSIIAEYRVNGVPVPATGTLEMNGDKLDWKKKVTYPVRIKIDPLAGKYFFDIENDSTVHQSIEIKGAYYLSLSQFNYTDTIGFRLNNPYKIPVFYSVMNGDHLVAAGKGESETLQWTTTEKNARRAYRIKWQYLWGGAERTGEGTIGFPYKQLGLSIKGLPAVFPGQKDTITVEVKDFKQNPAGGVDLTAFSYNSQFKKDISIPNVPYLAKYKLRPGISRDTYEDEDAYITEHYNLGSHQQWRKKFGLDTMLYYQMLFPDSGYLDVTSVAKSYYPQVSIHVVQQGIPQQVYLLYLNKEIVYYYGVTDKKNYAFYTIGGYAHIAFRLYDKYIEVDSIYIQPNYKHDIVFDLDKLPARSKIMSLTNELAPSERQVLESSLWQFRNASYYNNGYVWQNGEALKLNNGYDHIVGPFLKFDSLHYFSPGNFDLHFLYEPGYQYKLSPKISRLEKMKVFPNEYSPVKLPEPGDVKWILGDTVMDPPVISYNNIQPVKYLRLTGDIKYKYDRNAVNTGSLLFRLPKDTALSYVVLYPGNDRLPIVLYGNLRHVHNLSPGNYTLLLVGHDLNAAVLPVHIEADHTTCIKTGRLTFTKNELVEKLSEEAMRPVTVTDIPPAINTTPLLSSDDLKGNLAVSGKVTDGKGKKPVPGVIVAIKGTTLYTITRADGSFGFAGLKEGKYIFVFSAVGYAVKEQLLNLNGTPTNITVSLEITNFGLDEVVVTAYGTVRKTERLASATVSAMNIKRDLSGKSFGLFASGDMNVYDSTVPILIRGIASASGDNKPLYIIDGIPYEELPKNISIEDMTSIEVLKDATATALYGAHAVNGVVIISTKTKTLRTQFRDYAFWQPRLFTDENGVAKFVVTYPDNITSWQTYVIGIDKKNRSGTAAMLTQAYKLVMAQLNVPQFAIEGDSLLAVAKTLNYTKDKYTVNASFSLSNLPVAQWNFDLPSSESVIRQQPIIAGIDTLKLQFGISTTTGFKDGEERKLPVFQKGTQETTGNFYILQQDTTIQFAAEKDASVQLYIQNNTLDVLLNELDHLQQYPYFCMEQIASKVKGYRMEQQVKEALHQDFRHGKDLQRLIEKLQKAQLYDGSWSWWEKGTPNIHITNYILQALLPLRKDALVEQSVRNGLLYLQNQLNKLNKEELLSTLSTMAQAGHLIDYQPYLSKINFDSLTLHQQWVYVQIRQQLRLEHSKELQYLIYKKTNTIFGGSFWGEETYRWYDNNTATTVLAYEVLQKEDQYKGLLSSIIQYFLETRNRGYWRNTVESASITSAILPQILREHKNFTQPVAITVSGDTNFRVTAFPFAHSFNKNIRQINIQKQGGGSTYLTFYQQWWNKIPEPVTGRFIVNTHFKKNDQALTSLTAGERIKLQVDVHALEQAEYIMIEVPIPAGCILVNKSSNGYMEYFKNKVVIFRELLTKGDHSFDIDLECRYAGKYTLNPAKVELMYFPVFFGRNGMRQVEMHQ